MRRTIHFSIRPHTATAMLVAAAMLSGCNIRTLPLHNPIFPDSDDQVTYTLQARAQGGIDGVLLFEQVSTIDAGGAITSSDSETLLNAWTPPGDPVEETFTFVRNGGYGANKLVTYRFEVSRNGGGSRSHTVTFATNPYPVTGQPAPVYAQGDPDDVLDVVFIPDTDINMQAFHGDCRGLITQGLFAEPQIRFWSRQFNFYINAEQGHATDFDSIDEDGLHQTPSNWGNLSFAEAKVLVHQTTLRDYAMDDGLFSTEPQSRGTVVHESGHALFGLADEYDGGSHWQADVLPNNWDEQAAAESDAPGRGKSIADVQQIGDDSWWRMCINNCTMKSSGAVVNGYDRPCDDRVHYVVIQTATDN